MTINKQFKGIENFCSERPRWEGDGLQARTEYLQAMCLRTSSIKSRKGTARLNHKKRNNLITYKIGKRHTSLVTREMQIQIMMKYHYPPIRMEIKNFDKTKC